MRAAVPELLEENSRSKELWDLVGDQMRIGPKGPFALDLGAIATVFDKIKTVDNIEFELMKMNVIFAIVNRKDVPKKEKKKMPELE